MHRMKVEKLVGNLDWFITSDWTEPPSHMKKATIIHDLAYLKYPETIHETILQTQKQRMNWVKKGQKLFLLTLKQPNMMQFNSVDLKKKDIRQLPGCAVSQI